MVSGHRYTREVLAEAVASSHSWRGVLRHLGRLEHSAGALRVIRREVKAFGIDHSHFTGQRRWSDRQLIDAIASARSWRLASEMPLGASAKTAVGSSSDGEDPTEDRGLCGGRATMAIVLDEASPGAPCAVGGP